MREEFVFPDVDCLKNVSRIGNFAVLLNNVRSLISNFSNLELYLRYLSIKPDVIICSVLELSVKYRFCKQKK